jgi:pimeloyl-ACP methyl ester carboxylesterase
VVTETDVELPDGRTPHVYDTAGGDGRLAVFWHQASVAAVADTLGIGRSAVMGHSGGSNHALAAWTTLACRTVPRGDVT